MILQGQQTESERTFEGLFTEKGDRNRLTSARQCPVWLTLPAGRVVCLPRSQSGLNRPTVDLVLHWTHSF